MVRLTAATALQQCVDVSPDIESTSHTNSIIYVRQADLFDLNVFLPFLSPAVAELLQLIDQVDTIETKNKLAACLNTIIGRSTAEVPHSTFDDLPLNLCPDCPLSLSHRFSVPTTMYV